MRRWWLEHTTGFLTLEILFHSLQLITFFRNNNNKNKIDTQNKPVCTMNEHGMKIDVDTNDVGSVLYKPVRPCHTLTNEQINKEFSQFLQR